MNRLSVKEMEEVTEIRLRLESLAVEKSCDRRPEAAVPKCKTILEGLEKSVRDPKKYLSKNYDFHFEIYSYAESPLLLKVIDAMWVRVGPYMVHTGHSGDLSMHMNFHRQMFEGFAQKDKDRLLSGLRGDLQNGAQFIISHLESWFNQRWTG